jgi:TetR/AcrR family transcriptional repressor of nem operon
MYYEHLWSKRERDLLEAALPLVARAGAHSMSFQDLADAVRIRKASVHYHFPTKSDLLIALIDGYDHVLTCEFGNILRSTYSGDNKLRLCISELASLFGAFNGILICPCAMLSAEVVSLKPAVAGRLAKFFKDRAKALTTILEEGREDGSLRFSGPAEPLAWVILSFVEGAMLVARATDNEMLFFD